MVAMRLWAIAMMVLAAGWVLLLLLFGEHGQPGCYSQTSVLPVWVQGKSGCSMKLRPYPQLQAWLFCCRVECKASSCCMKALLLPVV